MGVGLGGSGRHEQHQNMEENHVTAASPSIGKVMNSSMEVCVRLFQIYTFTQFKKTKKTRQIIFLPLLAMANFFKFCMLLIFSLS